MCNLAGMFYSHLIILSRYYEAIEVLNQNLEDWVPKQMHFHNRVNLGSFVCMTCIANLRGKWTPNHLQLALLDRALLKLESRPSASLLNLLEV